MKPSKPLHRPMYFGNVEAKTGRDVRSEIRLTLALLVLTWAVKLLPRYREGNAIRLFIAVICDQFTSRRLRRGKEAPSVIT